MTDCCPQHRSLNGASFGSIQSNPNTSRTSREVVATMRAPRRGALPPTRGAFDDAGTAAHLRGSAPSVRSSPGPDAGAAHLSSESETAPPSGYRRIFISLHSPRSTIGRYGLFNCDLRSSYPVISKNAARSLSAPFLQSKSTLVGWRISLKVQSWSETIFSCEICHRFYEFLTCQLLRPHTVHDRAGIVPQLNR